MLSSGGAVKSAGDGRERSSEARRRHARAALIWHHRVNLGRTLDILWVRPAQWPVPSPFSVEELAMLREAVLRVRPSPSPGHQRALVHPAEHEARPGGLKVHGAVPLGPVSRAAVIGLRQLPPGKRNTLVVTCQHRVQD
jgi:hypothetical protein